MVAVFCQRGARVHAQKTGQNACMRIEYNNNMI